ncbi:MAG: hypothetical protein LBJ84_06350, partial [Oscillospiraceae bacterium]|nr:hypothetical protein [Oscillospiraceae bacterium]
EIREDGGPLAEAITLMPPYAYKSFAYTTKKNVAQNDRISVLNTAGSIDFGPVLRYDDSSPLIGSVKDPGTPLRVKLSSIVGMPSVTNILKDSTGVTSRADFTSTGHHLLYGAVLDEGGFRYSKYIDGATGSLTGDIGTKTWAEQTANSPKTEAVDGLEPNTRYYMSTYLNTDISGTPQNLTSGTVTFATLPYIESASASGDPAGNSAALISADFYESAAENIAIEGVTIYWDTEAIDAGTPENADNCAPLSPGAFSDAGVASYRIENLAQGAVYNILIVIENIAGADSFAFEYAAPSEINVSVPVKLIFAAFEADAGAVTSPAYYIKNNSDAALSVTVDSFDERYSAGLTLTKEPPNTNEIRLKLQGAGASLGIGMANYLEDSDSIDEALCTLQGAGTVGDMYHFTLGGEYNGAFGTAKTPKYFLVLKFVPAPP